MLRQRQPRKIDKAHKGYVAQLPCVICGTVGVHVAHVRYASAKDGADLSGKGMKPDDWRVLPLCPRHHVHGPESQHSMGEEQFWRGHGINPYSLARALYAAGGDIPFMERLVLMARKLFPATCS